MSCPVSGSILTLKQMFQRLPKKVSHRTCSWQYSLVFGDLKYPGPYRAVSNVWRVWLRRVWTPCVSSCCYLQNTDFTTVVPTPREKSNVRFISMHEIWDVHIVVSILAYIHSICIALIIVYTIHTWYHSYIYIYIVFYCLLYYVLFV